MSSEILLRVVHDAFVKSFLTYTAGFSFSLYYALRVDPTRRGAFMGGFLAAATAALARGVAQGPSPEANPHRLAHLRGGIVLVTGGSAGIGKELVHWLSTRGCYVVATSRNPPGEGGPVKGIEEGVDGWVEWLPLDLGSCKSADACARALLRLRELEGLPLTGVVLNAGIFPAQPALTEDGVEIGIGTNHLGHFALMRPLFTALKNDSTRVVVVSSLSHFEVPPNEFLRWDEAFTEKPLSTYQRGAPYALSKLANVLFARSLFERHQIDSCSVTPGLVKTDILHELSGFSRFFVRVLQTVLGRDTYHGIATIVAALMREESFRGEFMMEAKVAPCSRHGRDVQSADSLWELSEGLVANIVASENSS